MLYIQSFNDIYYQKNTHLFEQYFLKIYSNSSKQLHQLLWYLMIDERLFHLFSFDHKTQYLVLEHKQKEYSEDVELN
jgi:hypothetical protein